MTTGFVHLKQPEDYGICLKIMSKCRSGMISRAAIQIYWFNSIIGIQVGKLPSHLRAHKAWTKSRTAVRLKVLEQVNGFKDGKVAIHKSSTEVSRRFFLHIIFRWVCPMMRMVHEVKPRQKDVSKVREKRGRKLLHWEDRCDEAISKHSSPWK